MNRLICFLIITPVFLIFPQKISNADIFTADYATKPVLTSDPFLVSFSPKSPPARTFEQYARSLSNSPRTPLAEENMVNILLGPDLFKKTYLSDPAPAPLPRLTNLNFFDSPGISPPEDPEKAKEELKASRWICDIFGGAAFGDQQGELYTVNFSFEKHNPGRWSLAWQPFAGVGAGKDDISGVIGLDAILKHPLLSNGFFTLNFEGGGGIQYAGTKSWPRDGSHFNWRPQFGFGIRFTPDKDKHALLGARYIHISNGGINSESNSGIDSLYFYAGLNLRF